MKKIVALAALAVAAVAIWRMSSSSASHAPDADATPAAATRGAPGSAPATAPTPSPSEDPSAAGSAAPDPRPAWQGQDLPPPPPPPPPDQSAPRTPRPDKVARTPGEQRALQAKGVALIELEIGSLSKEIDAATAAHDDARVAQLRVRLTRLQDTRTLRQGALDAPAPATR